jgi:hypothetical protein
VNTTLPGNLPIAASYDGVNGGGIFSGAYFFNRNIGVRAECANHQWFTASSNSNNIGIEGNDDGFYTVGGGVIARFPLGSITPFVHALADAEQISGPYHNPAT